MRLLHSLCRSAVIVATIAMLAWPAFGQAACCRWKTKQPAARSCCQAGPTRCCQEQHSCPRCVEKPCDCCQAPVDDSREPRVPVVRGELPAVLLPAPVFLTVAAVPDFTAFSVEDRALCEDRLALFCIRLE